MKKILLKMSILFLAAASCLFGGQISSAQESELWRKDWQKFGEAIAPYARDVRSRSFPAVEHVYPMRRKGP